MLPDLNTSVGHSFGLEVDGLVVSTIQEVSGLAMKQATIDLKQNTSDGKYMVMRLPGRPEAGEVTLTRGLTSDTGFDDCVNQSQFGQMSSARKNASVIVYDYEGTEIKRYNLTNAWPKSLELESLKAGDTNVLTEKLTVVYETL